MGWNWYLLRVGDSCLPYRYMCEGEKQALVATGITVVPFSIKSAEKWLKDFTQPDPALWLVAGTDMFTACSVQMATSSAC